VVLRSFMSKSSPPFPPLDRSALFLDFDGTLVEIVDHPDAVTITDDTRGALRSLGDALSGALAIVTGRDIAVIDRFLAPVRLPVAGIHGLTRRDANGRLYTPSGAQAFLEAAEVRLEQLASGEQGLHVERKSASIALHYRHRPELESRCIAELERLANGFPDIEIKRGKMVVEAKPGHADKGTAVRDFMSEAPFEGRQPVFAGDDVTDEDAFRVVNDLGGISIKVGEGKTGANYRMASTSEFLRWLASWAATGEGEAK